MLSVSATASPFAVAVPLLPLGFLGVVVWRYLAHAQAQVGKLSTLDFGVAIVGAAAMFYVVLRVTLT